MVSPARTPANKIWRFLMPSMRVVALLCLLLRKGTPSLRSTCGAWKSVLHEKKTPLGGGYQKSSNGRAAGQIFIMFSNAKAVGAALCEHTKQAARKKSTRWPEAHTLSSERFGHSLFKTKTHEREWNSGICSILPAADVKKSQIYAEHKSVREPQS